MQNTIHSCAPSLGSSVHSHLHPSSKLGLKLAGVRRSLVFISEVELFPQVTSAVGRFGRNKALRLKVCIANQTVREVWMQGQRRTRTRSSPPYGKQHSALISMKSPSPMTFCSRSTPASIPTSISIGALSLECELGPVPTALLYCRSWAASRV